LFKELSAYLEVNYSAMIFSYLRCHGGIESSTRRGFSGDLTFTECEEISRGLVGNHSAWLVC